MRQFISQCLLIFAANCLMAQSYASTITNPGYLLLSGGIFQGHFDMQYNDRTDIIPQNIHQPVQQNGYSGAIGVGYSRSYADQYLFGGELSANFYTEEANFASGASTTAFTDQLTIDRDATLSFIPGLWIDKLTAAYAKVGLSYAHVKSILRSPTDYNLAYVRSSNEEDVWGVALGLGAKRWMNTHLSFFAEYLYRDYGNINFADFQNFTAIYSRTTQLTTQNVVVGIHYHL